jgi:hypothetical protein
MSAADQSVPEMDLPQAVDFLRSIQPKFHRRPHVDDIDIPLPIQFRETFD